jgi:hypothetical protein
MNNKRKKKKGRFAVAVVDHLPASEEGILR